MEMDLQRRGVQASLLIFQGPPPPSSRAIHPDLQKVKQRWQEVCVDGQGAPDKTLTYKGSIRGDGSRDR